MNWELSRIRVSSPKTEHHEGRASRTIPLFPELVPYLHECFERAEPGTDHVIMKYRGGRANLRTHLIKIVERAELEMWGKPFQNLRSTRETELAETFSMHVVCRWIGNSSPVAAKHYLQLTDEHFDRAISVGVEQGVAHNAAHCAPNMAHPEVAGGYPSTPDVGISASFELQI